MKLIDVLIFFSDSCLNKIVARHCNILPPANEVAGRLFFTGVRDSVHGGRGGGKGGIPACLAGLQAHTQGGG